MSVHTMLMAILLWPTASISSGSVGFAASLTPTSFAVPVAAPDGLLRDAGAGDCACAVSGRATNVTKNARANPQSRTRNTRIEEVMNLSPESDPRGVRFLELTMIEES